LLQVAGKVAAAASAYAALGLQAGDKVGICGANCPEWMMAMQVSGAQGPARII
jgi:long-subunit acyl-CoA synthetase (AMP-forming)